MTIDGWELVFGVFSLSIISGHFEVYFEGYIYVHS
jgi:hypothetical protein